jgi:hypothetical protein
MLKEIQEPILPKSPPSPPSPLYRGGLDPVSSYTKLVVVHFWSEYDTGIHKMHQIEITSSDRVLDAIMLSIEKFYPQGADPRNFCLRLADKSGKPKTSMPVLDVNQIIMQIGVVRFVLCSKTQDVKRSEKFDEFNDLPNNEQVGIKGSIEQNTIGTFKKRICCCFSSD